MFHAFDVSRSTPQRQLKQPEARAPRLNRSCLECTRRKIRCDGGQPCGHCAHQKFGACNYRQRNRRSAASRSTLDALSQRVEDQARVLSQLFPVSDIKDLQGKSRKELLQLLRAEDVSRPEVEDDLIDSGQMSEDGEERDRQWDESNRDDGPADIQPSDDINAASLALDRHRRSYLGASSISAILRIIFRSCPDAKAQVAESAKGWRKADMLRSIPSSNIIRPPGRADSDRFIAAYFEHLHAITPMLNESDFRAVYASSHRADPAWCALVNMVAVLGSIAAGDTQLHDYYYKQAQIHLNLDSLGAGNLEILQALCLLGGYYLHYRNSPNMAYAILGAAHRVAIALGLHRESRKIPFIVDTAQRRTEARRRTWWSLICLDTWASMTLGRPTGRFDPSAMNTSPPTASDQSDVFASSLQASMEFCLIANRIQHCFARIGKVSARDLVAFDEELVQWESSLPEMLLSPHPCEPRLVIARDFMRNRYLNLRSILGRSVILRIATRQNLRHELDTYESAIVTSSRDASRVAIESISINWSANHLHVWNTTWYLFQACMLPLLFIAMETNAHDPDEAILHACSQSITKALDVFAEMTPWMRSSDRSRDIVLAIYEAVSAKGHRQTPSVTDGDSDFFGLYDEDLLSSNDLDWSAFLIEDENPVWSYADM